MSTFGLLTGFKASDKKAMMTAGAMEGLSRVVRTDHHAASRQVAGHDREPGRVARTHLDLSVSGRHIGPASARPAGQPRHSVSWDDGQQRPATSPQPAHGSASRNDWTGRLRLEHLIKITAVKPGDI